MAPLLHVLLQTGKYLFSCLQRFFVLSSSCRPFSVPLHGTRRQQGLAHKCRQKYTADACWKTESTGTHAVAKRMCTGHFSQTHVQHQTDFSSESSCGEFFQRVLSGRPAFGEGAFPKQGMLLSKQEQTVPVPADLFQEDMSPVCPAGRHKNCKTAAK